MSDVRVARVPLRPFEQSLPMALMRAREAVMRHFRPVLAEHDLSEQQWRVLRALRDARTPVSAGELARSTFLLGPSLSRMLVTLEERGLIERASGSDARRAEISISASGLDLVGDVAPASELAYGRIDALLEPGELDTLYSLLAKLTQPPPPGPDSPAKETQ